MKIKNKKNSKEAILKNIETYWGERVVLFKTPVKKVMKLTKLVISKSEGKGRKK